MGCELGLEVGRVGAARRLHLHTGLDERAQLVREAFEVRALAQEHEDGLDGVRAVEGRVAGGGEDEHRAEREDVTRAGHAAGVLRLLGRHVGGGADGDVGHRQTCVRHPGGDSEVDDARSVLDHEDVRRFQVTVDQAGPVDGLQGLRDTRREPADRLGRQRPALGHYLFEGGRGHIGGGQPGHGGACVGVHHGGRVEAGDGTGRLHLAREADPEQLVLGELRPDRLDRHPPARGRAREIDQPHAAGSQPSQHLERPDPPRIVLCQLIHHLPATSPYAAALPATVPSAASATAQRLTTEPLRRHAPRFFLAAAPVANPGPNRDVSARLMTKDPSLPCFSTPPGVFRCLSQLCARRSYALQY